MIILDLGHTFWFYGMPGYVGMLAIVNLTLVGGGYFYIPMNTFELFLGCSEVSWKHFDDVGSSQL